jgi:hypothetical protein
MNCSKKDREKEIDVEIIKHVCRERTEKKLFPLKMAEILDCESLKSTAPCGGFDTTTLTKTDIICRSATIVGLHTKLCRP